MFILSPCVLYLRIVIEELRYDEKQNEVFGIFLLRMRLWPLGSEAADPEVLKPRVPPAQIEEARS